MDILSQNHWEFKQSSPNSLLKTLPKPQSWKTLYYRVHTIVKTKLVETIGSFLILSHSSNAYEMDKSDYPPTAGWETIYPTPQNTNTFECSCSEQILEVLYFFRFSGFLSEGFFCFISSGQWVAELRIYSMSNPSSVILLKPCSVPWTERLFVLLLTQNSSLETKNLS